MSGYQPRHARRPDPRDLPAVMRGLADLIEIIADEESN